MCSWDIIEDLVGYSYEQFPELDAKNVHKDRYKQRVYEIILIEEMLEKCFDRPYNNPIEVLEDYEIVYEYYRRVFPKEKIIKCQLNMIRKLLIYLRKRENTYG